MEELFKIASLKESILKTDSEFEIEYYGKELLLELEQLNYHKTDKFHFSTELSKLRIIISHLTRSIDEETKHMFQKQLFPVVGHCAILSEPLN